MTNHGGTQHEKPLIAAALTAAIGSPPSSAAEYKIDPAHTFATFKVNHLGVSRLNGRFNEISGSFNYDAGNPADSNIALSIKTNSIDSNLAERDKHLRSDDFLDTAKYPTATFNSRSFDGKALTGDLTLHGVTQTITIDVTQIGEGKAPWGGYRAGFIGRYSLKRADFGISYNLGPAAEMVEMRFNIEGIRNN